MLPSQRLTWASSHTGRYHRTLNTCEYRGCQEQARVLQPLSNKRGVCQHYICLESSETRPTSEVHPISISPQVHSQLDYWLPAVTGPRCSQHFTNKIGYERGAEAPFLRKMRRGGEGTPSTSHVIIFEGQWGRRISLFQMSPKNRVISMEVCYKNTFWPLIK